MYIYIYLYRQKILVDIKHGKQSGWYMQPSCHPPRLWYNICGLKHLRQLGYGIMSGFGRERCFTAVTLPTPGVLIRLTLCCLYFLRSVLVLHSISDYLSLLLSLLFSILSYRVPLLYWVDYSQHSPWNQEPDKDSKRLHISRRGMKFTRKEAKYQGDFESSS